MEFDEYRAEMERTLSPCRAHHSVCVAQAARRLAKRYGADEAKAEIAGILHDCMKETPVRRQLQMIEESGIILSTVERRSPKLLHAISGAVAAKERYGVADTEILDAIRCHTTGRGEMTMLDKVLYLADFVSADRDFKGVGELRRHAEQDLDRTLIECLGFSIGELSGRLRLIHPDTFEAYNGLLLKAEAERDG